MKYLPCINPGGITIGCRIVVPIGGAPGGGIFVGGCGGRDSVIGAITIKIIGKKEIFFRFIITVATKKQKLKVLT